jgi:Domain of unknown function (DUF4203)
MPSSKTYLIWTMSTLFSAVMGQTINRCMPFFASEKLGFDLVKIDTANLNKPFMLTGLTFPESVTKLVNGANMTFRLCNAVDTPTGCPTGIPQVTGYFAEGSDCRPLNLLQTTMIPSTMKDSNGKVIGVVLDYNSDSLDPNVKKAIRYNMKFRITCDKNITGIPSWSFKYETNYAVLSTSHAAGCSYGLSDILDIFENNKYICCSVFCVIGLLFTLFGRSAFRWTMLLCGLLIGFILVAGVCYAMGMFVEATEQKKYMILGGAILAGIIFGFIMFYFDGSTISLVCGILSVMIVKALMTLFFPGLILSSYVEMGILIAAGIIGGAIGSCFKE